MTTQKYLSFTKDENTQSILKEWHEGLSNGSKAELKRCNSLEEVAFTRSYHDLKLRLASIAPADPVKLTLVAGLSSHVKSHNPSLRLAQQMAEKKGSADTPMVSELRFRRLLAIDEPTELYRTMIRIIRMLGGEVNLLSLADSVYWWNSRTKKQFASDYFEKITTKA